MEAIAYLNGSFVGVEEKVLPLEERGLQFGDSIYEVIKIYRGKPFALLEHLERLTKSADSILLNLPKSVEELAALVGEGIERIGLTDGTVYIQLTRGNAPRNHPFPLEAKENFMLIWKKNPKISNGQEEGMSLITVPDDRWSNCFIKTTCLLPNVLAKEKALRQGADEALFIRDNVVKECSSMNIFLVKDGIIKTPPADKSILNGITRQIAIKVARENNLQMQELELKTEDLQTADEIFVTSTTKELVPVVKVDGLEVADGKPGKIYRNLHQIFKAYVSKSLSLDEIS